VHRSSHKEVVFSCVRSSSLHALVRVKHQVVGWASNVFACAFTTLLWQFALKLFMCLFVHHDRRWRHVSFWRDVHRLHVGDMSYLRMCFF
jgi:hypothetical protein